MQGRIRGREAQISAPAGTGGSRSAPASGGADIPATQKQGTTRSAPERGCNSSPGTCPPLTPGALSNFPGNLVMAKTPINAAPAAPNQAGRARREGRLLRDTRRAHGGPQLPPCGGQTPSLPPSGASARASDRTRESFSSVLRWLHQLELLVLILCKRVVIALFPIPRCDEIRVCT